MSETASISTGIAGRYATAVFSLAKDDGTMADLERDVDALDAALRDSADLRTLIVSPIYTRDQQGKGIEAIAARMELGATVTNVLRLMATKRRLFVLPQMIVALRNRIAADKGEVTAEVTSAVPLSQDQSDALSRTLSAQAGKDVKIISTVDESLIGGLVVKVGSRMIDTSIASKLKALQNSMKEAR